MRERERDKFFPFNIKKREKKMESVQDRDDYGDREIQRFSISDRNSAFNLAIYKATEFMPCGDDELDHKADSLVLSIGHELNLNWNCIETSISIPMSVNNLTQMVHTIQCALEEVVG
jgi:hypothetical protein